MLWYILTICGEPLLFDWDDANLDHIAEHGVEPEEGERRYAVLGSTEDGRRLFVVFTRRGSATRVISARDATDAEKQVYRTRGK